MADVKCLMAVALEGGVAGGYLFCWLPKDHDGPHYDLVDRVTWKVTVMPAGPGHLTPSADIPACRDEDPAYAKTLSACYPEHDSGWPPMNSEDMQ